MWQCIATAFSVLGALLLWPVSYVEENLMLKQDGGTVRHVGSDEVVDLNEEQMRKRHVGERTSLQMEF